MEVEVYHTWSAVCVYLCEPPTCTCTCVQTTVEMTCRDAILEDVDVDDLSFMVICPWSVVAPSPPLIDHLPVMKYPLGCDSSGDKRLLRFVCGRSVGAHGQGAFRTVSLPKQDDDIVFPPEPKTGQSWCTLTPDVTEAMIREVQKHTIAFEFELTLYNTLYTGEEEVLGVGNCGAKCRGEVS